MLRDRTVEHETAPIDTAESFLESAPVSALTESQIGSSYFTDVIEHHPLAHKAMNSIARVMDAGNPCVCAFSSGKDSSAVVGLTLTVAAERVAAGLPVPRILVLHSNTGVENPEVRTLADNELAKMVRFADANRIPLEVRVGTPSLYTSWAVRVIGGRALPSFPTAAADCSVDWKITTGNRLTNEAFDDLRARPEEPQPVLMTGVRLDESARRAANITSRGETAEEVWADDKGRLRISPIIHWSTDDVFEYLGYAAAGIFKTYSDFAETMQFYRDAGGSSCAVVGDMALEDAAKQGGCGARSGCWVCVKVQKDKSLETMISTDLERYGYMGGLNRLRDFMANTQYDWDSRNYLGRTIDANGDVAVQADVYSPTMLENLLRYTLTLQLREQVAAGRKGIKPRFSVIGYKEIIAIDAMWSLYGIHPPFHAIKVFDEVRSGKFLNVPISGPVPRAPVPRYGKIHVGTAWDDDIKTGNPVRARMLSGGIRSHMHEMVSESCGDAGFGIKQLPSGDLVTAWDTVGAFDVDEEGAGDWIEFFGQEEIDKHHDADVDRTIAVRTYLGMGFLTPAHASLGRWHEIARRTQWMQRQGLCGEVQRGRLLAMMDMQAEGRDPFDYELRDELDAAAAVRDVTLPVRKPEAAAQPPLQIDEDGFVSVAEPAPSEMAGVLEQGFQRDMFAEANRPNDIPDLPRAA